MVHAECYGTLSEKNDKHKTFVCDVCSHDHGSGYGSLPDSQKRTAYSPLLTSVDEKLKAHGKSVSCILCPAKLGAMKKASLTLPASQRVNQSNPVTTAWVHVSCAEPVRGATTNPFADSVEINPSIFGGTIHFSGQPSNKVVQGRLRRNRNTTRRCPFEFVYTLLFAKRRMCRDVCVRKLSSALPLVLRESCRLARRFSDGSGSSKRQPRAYCDCHSPVQRQKDENKGVQVAKLSLTDDENEVMVLTVRTSADGETWESVHVERVESYA